MQQEVSEVSTNLVLPAKFESAEALGSEMFPELAFLVGSLSTKPAAAIARGFVVSIHNRAPQKAR